MMIKMCVHIVCVVIAAAVAVHAQTQVFSLRSAAGLKANFSHDLSLSLDAQSRIGNNLLQFGGMYYTLSAKYKITDELKVAPELRLASSSMWDKVRYGIGVEYKIDLGKIDLELRALYQFEHYSQSIADVGQYPDKQNLRCRLLAEYKIKKRLHLFASVEPQYRIEESIGSFQRIRNVVGVNYEVMKHHTFTFAFFIQPQYASTLQKTNFISSLAYSYELPNFFTKKQKDEEE